MRGRPDPGSRGVSRLHADQQAFQSHLMTGSADVRTSIVGDAKATADTRLEVYYQAYRLRLVEILQNDFTGVHALLGTDAFREMVLRYIAAHPSEHPSVRWFGRHLAGFLALPPYAEHPELAEMAQFEWAWAHAFDAADVAAAGPDVMTEVAPEAWAGLRVTAHPSLQRLDLSYNVPALFEAATRDDAPPPLVRESEPLAWMLWRRELIVHWRSQAADEAWALSSALAGQTFGDLCAGLCGWHAPDAVPLRAATLLRTWLEDGLLSGVDA